MWEEATIELISMSPVADIKLLTRVDAGTDWNCIMPTVGMVGFAVGCAVGFRVGAGVIAMA